MNLEFIFILSRKDNIVKKRQIFHYLSSLYTNKSLQEIGAYYSLISNKKYSHAAVLHSIKTIKQSNKLLDDIEKLKILLEKQGLEDKNKRLDEKKKLMVNLIMAATNDNELIKNLKHIEKSLTFEYISSDNLDNKTKLKLLALQSKHKKYKSKQETTINNLHKEIILLKDLLKSKSTEIKKLKQNNYDQKTLLFKEEHGELPTKDSILFYNNDIYIFNGIDWNELRITNNGKR